MSSFNRRGLLQLAVGATVARTLAPLGGSASASSLRMSLGQGTGQRHRTLPTRYGVNAEDRAIVDSRLSEFGSVGVARVFYTGMLPRIWNSSMEGSSPDQRCQVSFKVAPRELAAGAHDSTIISWMESIPSNWCAYLTFWHEPNDELNAGEFTGAEFCAAWSRLNGLRAKARLRSGVRLPLVPVFMAYQVSVTGRWSDSWIPRPHTVNFISWDIYGNPAGGSGLDGPYPSPRSCIDPCLRVSERLGFRRWGVTEFNTPRRNWDTDEVARTNWLAAFRNYAVDLNRPVAPQLGPARLLLLWEGDGANWDQRFVTSRTRNWWANVVSR